MGNVFDRLSRGPQGQQSSGFDNWNEMVGAAPRDQFSRAISEASREIDPDDYYRHTQPGVDGTDPLGGLTSAARGGLASSLLGALLGSGASQSEVGRVMGNAPLDPNRMTPDQLAQLAQYAQRNHPDALARVAAENQDNPGLLEGLLGNKWLLTAAAILGTRYLSNKMNESRTQAGDQLGSHRK